VTASVGGAVDQRTTGTALTVGTWLVGAAVFVAVAVAQLYRQAGVRSWRTVWAEDGSVYFGQTRGVGNLFQGYAGYLQLHPRILGLIAHHVPLPDVAIYYAVAGALVTTAAAAAVWAFSGQLVGSKVLRAILALNVPFISALLLEQTANGVNTIWAVLFAGWWALLYRPKGRVAVALAGFVAFFAATSNALSLLYLPMAAFLIWRRRDRPTVVVAGAFVTGCVLQCLVSLSASDTTPPSQRHLADLPGIYLVRALGSGLVGEHWLPDVWSAIGWGLAVIGGVFLVAALALLVPRCKGDQQILGALTVGYSILMYVAPVYDRSTVGLRIESGEPFIALSTRYTTLSMWLLASGLFVLVSGARMKRQTRVVITSIVAIHFALLAVVGFRGTNPRSTGTEWKPSVASAQEACRTDPTKPVTIDVVPYPFDVVGTCAELGLP